jgi:hypothetical protein
MYQWFFFDDFHHNGAYLLSYWKPRRFWYSKTERTTSAWYQIPELETKMIISFMNAGPLSNLDAFYGKIMSFGNS